jgi:hypothetical protein
VGDRTDTSEQHAESVEPLLLHKIGPMDAKKQGVPTESVAVWQEANAVSTPGVYLG